MTDTNDPCARGHDPIALVGDGTTCRRCGKRLSEEQT